MRDKEFRAKNKDSDFSHKTAADTVLGRANRDNRDFSVPQNKGASARNSRYAKHQTDTDNSGTLNNAPYENRYDIRDTDYNTDNQQTEQQAEDIREVRIDNQPDTPRRYSQPSHEQPKSGFSDTVSSAVKNRRYQQHYKREHSNEIAAEQAESVEYLQTEPEQPNSYEQPEQPKQAETHTEPGHSNTYEPTEYSEPPAEDADFLPRRSEPISADNEPIVENKPTAPKRSGDYNIRDAARTADEAFDRITGKSDFRLGGDKLNRRAETAAEPKQQQRKRIYETVAKTVDEADAEPTEVDITENKIADDDTEFVKTDFQLGKQPERADEQPTAKSAEKTQKKTAFQKKRVKSDKSEVYNIKDAVDTKEKAFDKISESSDYEFKPRNDEYSFRPSIDTKTVTEPKQAKRKYELSEKASETEVTEATDTKPINVEPVRISDKTEFVKTDFQLGKQPERADERPTAKSAEKPQQKTAFHKKRVKSDKSEVYNIKDAVDNKETAFDRVTEPVDYEFQTQGGEEYSFRSTTEESKAFDKHEPRLRQDKRQSKTEPIKNTEPDASVPDTDIPETGDFQFTRDTRKKTKSETAGAKPENPKQRQKTEQGKSEAADQDKPAKKSKRRLRFEDEKPKRDLTRPVRSAAGAARFTAAQAAHSKVRENEDDNSGVEAAHFTEQKAERALQFSSSRVRNILNQHRRAEPQKKPQRLQFNPKNTEVKGNAELQKKSAVRKFLQKKQIKKKYQQAKRAEQNAQTAKKTVKTVKDVTVVTVEFVKRHKKAFTVVILIALLIAWVISTVSSCAVMGTTAVNSIMATTYLSEDEDIYAAEEYYKGLESDLQTEIDNIESDYSGYDEYNYDLAQIGHNPYELTSYLTAKYLDFVFDDTIKAELDSLFEQQYILTLTEDVEIYTDDEGNEYEYYILNVTLVNKSITALANTALTEDQRELYDIYLEGKGNRDYLFEDDIYSNPAEPPSYTIPGEALSDETFRRLITEAEKYLGYPYVWGGSSPSTSFDCSGFVCWVFKNSGVYPLERTTAQGICDQCAIIPRSEAKPGDIIFFTGTYNAGEPVTHVGIYVGDGMMIHCGNPIQYASIDTPYWTEHFYCFGRLN